MAEERRTVGDRAVRGTAPPPTPILSDGVLNAALTPRGLFTNLFPFTFSGANLGTVKATQKADKSEFDNRKRPSFYEAGDTLYAYGPGLDDFRDVRFTPAIVAIEQAPDFAQHLLRSGLTDFFRGRGFLVKRRFVGLSVLDHTDPIASAESGYLHILPEYNFQVTGVEAADGRRVIAVSIEPTWSSVPAFEIGTRLERFSDMLLGVRLVLECKECNPTCPLFDRLNNVVGEFKGFAPPGTTLTSKCVCADYTPQPINILQRTRVKGSKEVTEDLHVIPGQVVKPAAGQRRVLKLFNDRPKLEAAGRVWLGDLTSTGKTRADGLHVRYSRIQQFLARIAGHDTGTIQFQLPTGTSVTLQRLPVCASEVAGA